MLPRHFTDLDDQLAVGSFPSGPSAIDALAATGVTAVVNLQSDADLQSRNLDWSQMWMSYTRAGIKVTRVPVIDFDVADLARNLTKAVAAVAKHVDADRKVYVHCNAGLNRSPSTVIGFLIRHRGMSPTEAIAWVGQRHRSMPYEDVIVRWAAG